MIGCARCAGATEPGWVCADHPERPWEHGGCEAEGAPCPDCNPGGRVEWVEVYATADPAKDLEQ